MKSPNVTRESFVPLEKPARIDREKGIAYGVRFMGNVSANGGRYPDPILDRHLKLYEDCPVNLDVGGVHQRDLSQDVPVTSRFGRAKNLTVREGIRGDLHFNPKHQFADAFIWACENAPDHFGFSPLHTIGWRNDPDGSRTAESVIKVFSIELVSDPATTRTVYESTQMATESDPRMIAATITTPDSLNTFLASFFDALPSGAFGPEAKAAALEALLQKFATGDVVPEDEMVAAESLRRRGRLGSWAADRLTESIREKRRAAAVAKAKAACDAKSLPAHLQTQPFLETVAESIDNAARVEALIADRAAVGKPAGTTQAAVPPHTTTGTGGPAKSVKDLVAEALVN